MLLRPVALLCCLLLSVVGLASAQTSSQIPVMDGGAGKCSILLTVMSDGKPVYSANVKVHIEYGFGGFHRLDLEAYTNSDGKVKFTGLPAKAKNAPLAFHATKNQLAGIASYDPAVECQTTHDLPLEKQKMTP